MKHSTKAVLITGCSSGIGLSLARGLQNGGFQVIASCRHRDDTERLQQQGIDSLTLDLNDSDSIRSAVQMTLKLTEGRLFALINNGAYGQPGAVEDLSRDVLRAQFETNVFGTQELSNLVIPIMRAAGQGRIIQISSILGLMCLKFRGAYNASKYALEALSDTLRLELDNSGIAISLIEPGPIDSDFRKNALKMYHQNIDRGGSTFRDTYTRVESRLQSNQAARFTLPPEAVLKAVLHALTSKRPKIRYRVTTPTRVLSPLKRILPDRLMDRILLASSDPD